MIAIHKHHVPLYFHIHFSNFTRFFVVPNHTTMEFLFWGKQQVIIYLDLPSLFQRFNAEF